MRIFKISGILAVALFLLGSSAGAGEVKIGVIDLQKIIGTSVKGKAADAEMNKKGEELTSSLKAKEEELGKLQEKLEKEALVMSEDMREEKEREFRIKVGDFKALEKKSNQEMGELKMKLLSKIQADLASIIEDLGKKGGFTVILERRALLFAGGAVDVTDEVIKSYDASSKGK